MAAGLSKKQIYTRVYNRLNRLTRLLRAAGFNDAHYENKTVELEDEDTNFYFGAYYRVGNMSNGETCGMLRTVLISRDGTPVPVLTLCIFEDIVNQVKAEFEKGIAYA